MGSVLGSLSLSLEGGEGVNKNKNNNKKIMKRVVSRHDCFT